MRSERRKRLSFALISNWRRCCAGSASAAGWRCARARRLRAVDESDDSLERDAHFEPGRTRALPAGFNPGIFGNRGSNGVG
jgi:hypothetical protein